MWLVYRMNKQKNTGNFTVSWLCNICTYAETMRSKKIRKYVACVLTKQQNLSETVILSRLSQQHNRVKRLSPGMPLVLKIQGYKCETLVDF